MIGASQDKSPEAVKQEASEAFIRRAVGALSEDEQHQLDVRLATDPSYASAFHGMEKSWRSIGAHAESLELMKLRESAIAWARRENQKRWGDAPRRRRRTMLGACAAAAVCALAIGLQLSSYGYHPGLYRTAIGQQTKVDLVDHSQVELDAATRLQVRFTDTERTVRLLEGQAQFSVAKDPSRPFRVIAGDQTIVAVGTQFTVEYVDGKVHVATLEGKVTVSPAATSRVGFGGRGGVKEPSMALTAGEELRVATDGKVEFVPKAEADLVAATAWREGNVVFRDETLGDAVRRLNRYSRLQLLIVDPSLAMLRVSGVFQKGDSVAFARSVQAYYPAVIDETDDDSIRLRLKN